MQIKEIYIRDLIDFVHSEIYKKMPVVPISIRRAISQTKNPRADANDLALLLALDNDNNLLGFAGALPEWLLGEKEQKIYWNSGWWVDPKRGKAIAVPLLYQLFKKLDYRVFFNDLPFSSLAVIEKTGQFNFLPQFEGYRFIYQFNVFDYFSRKYTLAKKLKPIFIGSQTFLNSISLFLRKTTLAFRAKPKLYNFKRITDIQEVENFISRYDQSLFKRNTATFEWILNQSWLSDQQESLQYPFSLTVKSFHHYLFSLREGNELVSVIWLTERNGIIKLQYFFGDHKHVSAASYFLQQFINQNNFFEFISFHNELNALSGKYFSLYKMKIIRNSAYPKKYEHLNPQQYIWQAGEGDAIFT